MIEFKCSECGKQLRVNDDAAGKKGKCPQCGAMIVVPGEEMVTIEAAQPLRATPPPPPSAGAEERANTTAPEIEQKPGPRGIGGWLIIPAIGLVLAPIRSAVMLFMGISIIQSFAPELTSDPRLWLSGVIDVAMIVATIIVAVLFFKKKRNAVRAIIALMAGSILANIVQAFLNAAMFEEVDAHTIKPVIHACVFGAVWIPYFVISKRVKNTFTE
jgi:DNA-directed RNA polymerase subunit RPC12/RpoP